ncbi:MAG: alr0857 family protein [Cyanobacteria bacterium P01_G01_bin.67]
MLKITYLEDDVCLEYLSKSVAVWKSERILLNLRAAVGVFTESSIATLVFPTNLTCLKKFVNLAKQEQIGIVPCDEDYIEVSLSGTWIAQAEDSEAGIFVCEISHDCEYLLAQLWQESKITAPVN